MATKAIVSEKPTRRTLKNLLNNVEDVHKRDISQYSSGYLNESKLYKPPIDRSIVGTSWDNAHKPIPSLASRSAGLATLPVSSEQEKKMKESMTNFSIGTSGNVIQKSKLKSLGRSGTKSPLKVHRTGSASSQGSYKLVDDGVLIEHIGAAETMVNVPTAPNLSWSDYDYAKDNSKFKKPYSQAELKDQNLTKVKHKFIPSHINAVTKTDQYRKMKQFENNILQTNETREQNVMSGAKAVEHLEERLRNDLENLQIQTHGPNFHRLQMYSNIFEDLIDESPTFKYILGVIKKEYDDYISHLLDQQPSRHKLLYDQVEQLTNRGTSNPTALSEEQQKLQFLEEHTKSLLDRNDELRKALAEERLSQEDFAEEEEPEEEAPVIYSEPDLDIADKIEEAHATILEKIDQIKLLRKTLREEYVPSNVINHLEQCVKETEVESQRYQSQKDFFTQSCEEAEKELKEVIEEADTTEKDAKRIWKQVYKMSGENESENGEEEAKWNWYIS